MIDNIIATLLDRGLDLKARSAETQLLRQALRERLAREVRLNLAIFNLVEDRPTKKDLADLLSVDAFHVVCTLNLPLSIVLEHGKLAPKAADLLAGRGGKEMSNGNFKLWAAGISSEVELVERIWHRLHVLKGRKKIDGRLGNIDYLAHLLRALDISLQTTK